MDSDLRGPEHPVASGVMLKRADEADRNERNVELLRQPKRTRFEFADSTVARALAFRENDEAHATVYSAFCKTPHALQIRRATHIGNWNISKALHQQAVYRNFEMRFQFPAAGELRNRTIKHERVKQVHVVRNEDAGAFWVKA